MTAQTKREMQIQQQEHSVVFWGYTIFLLQSFSILSGAFKVGVDATDGFAYTILL